MRRVDCLEGYRLFRLLAESGEEVSLVKVGEDCYIDKVIDVKCTKSARMWSEYVSLVRDICMNRRRYVFNVRVAGLKVPSKFAEILACRGFAVKVLSRKYVLVETDVDTFCSKERSAVETLTESGNPISS
jgi:abortive infection bacteriophage resistance protein